MAVAHCAHRNQFIRAVMVDVPGSQSPPLGSMRRVGIEVLRVSDTQAVLVQVDQKQIRAFGLQERDLLLSGAVEVADGSANPIRIQCRAYRRGSYDARANTMGDAASDGGDFENDEIMEASVRNAADGDDLIAGRACVQTTCCQRRPGSAWIRIACGELSDAFDEMGRWSRQQGEGARGDHMRRSARGREVRRQDSQLFFCSTAKAACRYTNPTFTGIRSGKSG